MNDPARALQRFWLRWVIANAVAEWVGLGVVAAAGFALFKGFAEPQTWQGTVVVAMAFVALGAFEGLAVGIAQAAVLRSVLPGVRGWVRSSVAGAMAAWALGMAPSTVAHLLAAPGAQPPPEPPLWLVLVLASALGAVAGPILAIFQWRSLRTALPTGAWQWLPANAAAWCLGMPIIFLGAQANEIAANVGAIAAIVSVALLAAGAVVGAVHGWFLRRWVQRGA